MKKFYTLSILIYFSFNVQGQNRYFDLPNELKDNKRSIEEIFTITNDENGNLTLFIDDNKTFNAYIYNKEVKQVKQLKSDGLPNKYDNIIGYVQNGEVTTLFLQHRNKRKYGAIQFDFSTRQTKEIEFDFKLKKEAYIEALSKDNKLYLLTLEKNSSNLNIYTFNDLKQ